MVRSKKMRIKHIALTLLGILSTLEAQQDQEIALISTKVKFDPPRILEILRPNDAPSTGGIDVNDYFINRGQELNIKRGDKLNVYRERRVHPSLSRSMRIFIGTMKIHESQNGSSMGRFEASEKMKKSSKPTLPS